MSGARVTVVNQSPEPLMLEDGTQIGAALTPEARRANVRLSDRDRKRHVRPGRLVVIEQPAAPKAPARAAAKQAPASLKNAAEPPAAAPPVEQR